MQIGELVKLPHIDIACFWHISPNTRRAQLHRNGACEESVKYPLGQPDVGRFVFEADRVFVIGKALQLDIHCSSVATLVPKAIYGISDEHVVSSVVNGL